MILSDREIWMEIQSGRLKFEPAIAQEQVSPSAVDLRLSNQFTVLKKAPEGAKVIIDLAKNPDVEQIVAQYGKPVTVASETGAFEIAPGDFVLAYVMESIELPNYLAARVEGRSSLARLGISVHQTAPTVHATWQGQLRLEISNVGPFTIALRPGQSICQLILERLGTPSQSTLTSRWQGPLASPRQERRLARGPWQCGRCGGPRLPVAPFVIPGQSDTTAFP